MENKLEKIGQNSFMDNFVKTDDILKDMCGIIESSQKAAYQAVNTLLVQRNWLIGYRIAEEELGGDERSEYGLEVIKKISKELTQRYGKGYDRSNLYHCLKFYKTFPEIVDTACRQSGVLLSWSHYRTLLQVKDPEARDWYEKEAASAVETAGQMTNSQAFHEQIEYLERVTTNLHESVMKVRMVPIESVVNRFPRMIRDLNRKLDKKMELYMTGEETELDRTVIDEIGDPLMHLLRNSADHGLESNEERVRLGKPEVGSIFLDAYQDGNNVVIEVRDDGAGIDIDRVRQKAIDKGSITEKQAETMTDKDFIDLLFQPSFSTAEKITDISGRGVGLDVVKTKIEALGGNITAKTVAGEGSTFTISLPLTLAIIQALMVKVGEEKYAIPLGSINGIEDIAKEDISLVQSKEVINLRGRVIPILRLHDILDTEPLEEDPESLIVVIMQKAEQQVGLVIDELIGQQETVIKSLGHHITCDKLFSGATILGDGEVALILDTNTLM